MERREALRRTAKLAGTAALTPTLWSLLQSCKQQTRLNWSPLFLDDEQAKFISALVDTLLPKTDTPGALDMKVDMFLDKVFAEMYGESGQAQVVSEIASFNQTCKDRFGEVFTDLGEADRTALLNELEANSPKFVGKVWGTAVSQQEPVCFYRSMKSLAIWAYFSSEEVGKNILSYDPVPGDYLGCIPLSEVGNSWSL